MSNSKTYVLNTSGNDRKLWCSLLEQLPVDLRDIHYHPDYLAVYEKTYSSRATLLVHETEQNIWFQAFILRHLPTELGKEELQDLSSVYGYGGPLKINKIKGKICAEEDVFEGIVNKWAKSVQAVSEFCLLHPLLTRTQLACLPSVETKLRKQIVVMDLHQPLPVIWSKIEERQRKGIALARRKGVVIKRSDLSDEEINDFQKMYLATMERVNAKGNWHFPEAYWVFNRDCLGHENVSLFHATYNEKIIASFFMIHMYQTFYYHFACSDPEFRKLNPTSLLLFDTLLWARDQGFRWYHMGGGRTDEQDSLYKFKKSFGGQDVPLYSYNKILDQNKYDLLCKKNSNLFGQNTSLKEPIRFFPKYRFALASS